VGFDRHVDHVNHGAAYYDHYDYYDYYDYYAYYDYYDYYDNYDNYDYYDNYDNHDHHHATCLCAGWSVRSRRHRPGWRRRVLCASGWAHVCLAGIGLQLRLQVSRGRPERLLG
jgi:hypothetical protein